MATKKQIESSADRIIDNLDYRLRESEGYLSIPADEIITTIISAIRNPLIEAIKDELAVLATKDLTEKRELKERIRALERKLANYEEIDRLFAVASK